MARFCGSCGAPIADGTAFCAQCGASANPAPSQTVSTQPLRSASQPPIVASVQAGSSPVLKILLGVLVIIFVFGALAVGGLYYAAHRASQKLHAVADQITGSSSSNNVAPNGGVTLKGSSSGKDNYCPMLSKDDISRAIGVQIVDEHETDVGCEYLAHGTSTDMTAKHASAMIGTKGVDEQQKQMVEKFANGIFSSAQQESHEQPSDANGNTVVLAFGVDSNSANTQLKLNERVLGGLGPGSQQIAGIGDEAFDAAGGMMMVRKGNKLLRIMYVSCPCSTDAIKPLARKLADAL